jgi:AcrR family transcriptional regulator
MARLPDPSKKEKIVSAAITTFARKGYSSTTIAEVAKAAGIGKGTIYEYFRSKEDLFFATFERLISDTEQTMNQVSQTAGGSVSERLEAIADAVLKAWLANLDLYGLVLEFWSATASASSRNLFRQAFKAAYADMHRVVASLLQQGMHGEEFHADVDPVKVASALIGSWDALMLQAWLDPEFDVLGTSHAHMTVLLAGLRQSMATDGA